MATFSINIGLPTEATTYNLLSATATDLSVPLSVLYDNTNREITPSDLRNSLLTLWSNSIFTQTTSSGYEYVGIDTSNPSDRDLKNKIYIGKRAFSGTYSYNSSHDIMSSSLLNSDVDIFLFNTKRDSVLNSSTKVSILAGTSTTLWQFAPYLKSQTLTGTTSVSLDIVNPSLTVGNVNIWGGTFSTSAGTVSINNITFPSNLESNGLALGLTGAANDRLLFWNNGKLIWNDIDYPAINVIGTTGSPLNISGSTVYLNGYPLEFSDSRYTPFEVGDIAQGETFSMVEMVEVLRRIVYDYLPPICSVSLLPPYSSGYVEIGTSPLVKLRYSITKRTYPTLLSGLSNMVPTSYPPINTPGQTTISGTANGVVISPVTNTTTTFTVTVTDGTQSNSSSTILNGIYPYFYGFSSLSSMPAGPGGLVSLTKIIEPFGDKIVPVSGSGNFYFIYDINYPNLSQILDNFSNPVTYVGPYTVSLSSPSGLWASKQFKVYQINGLSFGPPSANYQFKY